MTQVTRTSYAASQLLLEIILDHGISRGEIEMLTGVQFSRITDPDGWIPMAAHVRLWEMAIDATRDPALALRLRKKTGMRMIHFVIQLALHSSTLLEALHHAGKYGRLISETDKGDILEEGNLLKIRYFNTSPHQARWLAEHHFSFLLELGRSVVEDSFNPVSVSFQHTLPSYKEVYDDVFRSQIRFGQSENSVLLRKKDLLQPIAKRDPYLQKVLMNYADSSMLKVHQPESLQDKITTYIIASLPNNETSLETAAAAMNMARSTLYRQLKMEGTSFQNLLLKIRQNLSKSHLRNGMTNAQVAYLLGFSEPSAFQRAFKSWYGITPGDYRKHSSKYGTDLKKNMDA